jgi:hypothetical protein
LKDEEAETKVKGFIANGGGHDGTSSCKAGTNHYL